MMAAPAALQREARRGILTTAKAAADLTDLVPVSSIAPEGEPVWPFVSVEAPRTSRLRASCVRGAVASFDIHVFAGPRLENGDEVESGYDHCSRIAASVERMFCEARIELESGAICKTTISDAVFIRDGEPDAWHWTAQLNCRVLA